jgi:hypothetical protein
MDECTQAQRTHSAAPPDSAADAAMLPGASPPGDTHPNLPAPPSPSHTLTPSPPHLEAAALLTRLHQALSRFDHPHRHAALQVLLDNATADFSCARRTRADPARLACIAELHFNNTTLNRPIDLAEPAPDELALATPQRPISRTTTLQLRRAHDVTRLTVTLSRAGPDQPWLIKTIDQPRPP